MAEETKTRELTPGEVIRKAREAKELSQLGLAQKCSMSHSQISRLEKDTLNILNLRVGNLMALSDVLEVYPEEIVAGRRKPHRRSTTQKAKQETDE